MKHALIVLAALSLAMPALAQTTTGPTAAPTGPGPAGPASDEAGPGADGGVKALRMSCREEAQSKGLIGPARREAVSACVVRQRPDLAGREQCRADGFTKGLRKEDLHAFVKECAKSKG